MRVAVCFGSQTGKSRDIACQLEIKLSNFVTSHELIALDDFNWVTYYFFF